MKDFLYRNLLGVFKQESFFYFLALCAVGGAAIAGSLLSNKTRQTFVFYDMKTGVSRTEERMVLKYPSSEEMQVKQYVEEAVFGPRISDSAPLFAHGTRLLSLLYRDGVVYINLSEDAAFPIVTDDTEMNAVSMTAARSRSFTTLDEGIKRNFPFVKQIVLFIEGHSTEY
ncbi:MAG: GerMN domain-containing protein [Treponema sp.]|nr:GerMN domain-containing protein [Treponema sp.]